MMQDEVEIDMKYDSAQLKQVSYIEAHQGGVYSLCSYGNMLYSCSNKEFKVWDLSFSKPKLVSTINAHNSFI